MAENIISPGVFTRENDLSFLPQGIGQIGAAVIGPTVKGPAFVPTIIRRGFGEFEARFGSYDKDTYVPLTVRNYLRNAGTVTVVRILGGGGYKTVAGGLKAIINNATDDSSKKRILTVLHPSKNDDADISGLGFNITGSSILPTTPAFASTFCLRIDGAGFGAGASAAVPAVVSASLDPTSGNYITRALGINENNSRLGTNSYKDLAYPFINFREYQTNTSISNIAMVSVPTTTFTGSTNSSGYAEGYDHAATPWITSGFTNTVLNTDHPSTGITIPLFKVHKIADGTQTNMDCKVSILNLKVPGDLDGEEQYSTFSLQIRKFGDTDKSPGILEQYNNLSLNPDAPNYIARSIGDRYGEWNEAQQKVVIYGDYPNKSRYIRIEVDAAVDNSSISPKLSPRGFQGLLDPIAPFVISTVSHSLIPYVTKSEQTLNSTFSKKAYLGWDFTKRDNDNYLAPIASVTNVNDTGAFNVDRFFGHAKATWGAGKSLSASIDQSQAAGPNSSQIKFSIPFQGGFDGMAPHLPKRTGEFITSTNLHGLNLSSGQAGFNAYDKALDIMSNQDEYDINMLALPGVMHKYHSSVTTAAQTFVEDRADCFYIMDLVGQDDKVSDAVSEAAGIDSNYVGSYFPWVKILDPAKNKPTFVPPSVIVPGAIAQSDRIAAEWFAPAGLNRGILGNVIEARTRLNQAERDQLYEGKVNPIATFPRTGVCIWGQKTLQTRPTALDRINVRRLLIEVKKFIASSSRYLVFEQNTVQTRNRFLNIVNPYLESVQQRQGLFAFRVQMDESNNTPDEIDRNRLVGGIFLQPTRTAEFIVLDFNILPTGATFDGGGGGGY